jgi:hypothetical protein
MVEVAYCANLRLYKGYFSATDSFGVSIAIFVTNGLYSYTPKHPLCMPKHSYQRMLSPPPKTNFSREEYSGKATTCPKNQNLLDPTKNCYLPVRLRKNYRPCILEGHLSTNPILSALNTSEYMNTNLYVFKT